MSEMRLHAVPQPLLENITKYLDDKGIPYEKADKELVRDIKLSYRTREDVCFRSKAALRCDVTPEEMKDIMEVKCHDEKYSNILMADDIEAELKKQGKYFQ